MWSRSARSWSVMDAAELVVDTVSGMLEMQSSGWWLTMGSGAFEDLEKD